MPIPFHSEAASRRVMAFLNTRDDVDYHTEEMHAMDAPERIVTGSTLRLEPKGAEAFAVSRAYRR